jgi:two-component system NtrC family sensor kinase
VLTFTSLLRKKMPDGSPDAEDLDLVIRETKRCASIIRRLLDFAREKTPVKAFFDLNLVITETVRFVDRPASLQNIDITLALAPTLPAVWGDANLIKQVVLNVLVNAQQAITGRGHIQVLTRLVPARPREKPEADAVEHVEIVIADDGCGIPADHLQRIFDPFFTSKEVGKGTGLGLSVSYGIVKSHGGDITVDSTEGVGTSFHIVLPLASPFGDAATGSPKANA